MAAAAFQENKAGKSLSELVSSGFTSPLQIPLRNGFTIQVALPASLSSYKFKGVSLQPKDRGQGKEAGKESILLYKIKWGKYHEHRNMLLPS